MKRYSLYIVLLLAVMGSCTMFRSALYPQTELSETGSYLAGFFAGCPVTLTLKNLEDGMRIALSFRDDEENIQVAKLAPGKYAIVKVDGKLALGKNEYRLKMTTGMMKVITIRNQGVGFIGIFSTMTVKDDKYKHVDDLEFALQQRFTNKGKIAVYDAFQ